MLSRLFNKDRSKKDTRLVFAMEVDGHRLYKYRSVNHMPLFRENVVRIGYAKLELGVRASDLQVFCDTITGYANEGNIAAISQLTGFLDMQLNEFASTRIALEIGGYAVLVDDEKHDDITDIHNAIKTKLLQHQTVVDFFLSESVTLVSALNNSISPLLMKESLIDPKRLAREKTFLAIIGIDMFQELWTTLTPPPSGWQKLIKALVSKKF